MTHTAGAVNRVEHSTPRPSANSDGLPRSARRRPEPTSPAAVIGAWLKPAFEPRVGCCLGRTAAGSAPRRETTPRLPEPAAALLAECTSTPRGVSETERNVARVHSATGPGHRNPVPL